MATLTSWNGTSEDADHDLLMDEIDHAELRDPWRPALRRYPRFALHRRLAEVDDEREKK